MSDAFGCYSQSNWYVPVWYFCRQCLRLLVALPLFLVIDGMVFYISYLFCRFDARISTWFARGSTKDISSQPLQMAQIQRIFWRVNTAGVVNLWCGHQIALWINYTVLIISVVVFRCQLYMDGWFLSTRISSFCEWLVNFELHARRWSRGKLSRDLGWR